MNHRAPDDGSSTRSPRGRRNRRKTLIWRTGVAAIVIAGGVILAFVLPHLLSEREQYIPGTEVEGITRRLERDTLTQGVPFRFADVVSEAGIDFRHFPQRRSTQLPEDMGSGAAWGDYDRDGDPDLYLVNIAGPLTQDPEEFANSPARNSLLENLGNGTFRDVTEQAGVGCREVGMGACWGDVDSDGYLDLFTTGYRRNHLFLNAGDRTFRDHSQEAGITHEGFWTGCSFVDYDNDGHLDLYVGGYVDYRFDPADTLKVSRQYETVLPHTLNPSSYPPIANLLYHNRGNGTFEEVAVAAKVDNPQGRSLSVAWCDFDLDGWQDLYVANDVSDNVMYRNLGNGTFEDVSHRAWVADYRGAMGLAVEDWDGDGDFDIFVTHWMAQENAFYRNLYQETPATVERTMRFVDEADGKGLGQIALDYIGWGVVMADFDADGLQDLVVANGSTFPQQERQWLLEPMRDLFFWNQGVEAGFFEVGAQVSPYFETLAGSRGIAAADYDRDGDLDLLIVRFGESPALLRNDGPQESWLRIKVEGPQGAPYLPGTFVRVVAGEKRWATQIGASASYLSQSDPVAHFGLGQIAVVDTVEIRRPGREPLYLENVPTRKVTTVTWDNGGGY